MGLFKSDSFLFPLLDRRRRRRRRPWEAFIVRWV